MEEPVGERPAPLVADDLRTEDDVPERTRDSGGKLVAAVDRERQDVGGFVDPEMLALQPLHLVRVDECNPKLTVVDPLGVQDAPRELDRARLVHAQAASVLDLDGDHRFRSSVCSLYASTIRCTSLCRTTSL